MTGRREPFVDDVVVPIEAAETGDGMARLVVPCPPAVAGAKAGQFVLAKSLLPGAPPLGRPMSVLFDGDRLEILFHVVGDGTRALAALRAGDAVNVVGPLGSPFAPFDGRLVIVADASHVGTTLALARERRAPVLYVTGHAADAPILRRLKAAGGPVTAVPPDDLVAALEAAAPERIIGGAADATMAGVQAFAAARGIPGEVELHAPIACGLGVCMVCVRPVGSGLKFVCKGPAFPLGDAVFGAAAGGAHG